MKRLIPWLLLVFVVTPLGAGAPPLDRYGGHYETLADTTTGVHYRFWIEPNINDFEYRSMMDNIYAVWNASDSVSECSRWKIVNILLETRVDPYLTYPPGVFRSSIPFDSTSLVWYSTSEAVAAGMLSTGTVNSQVAYSTIPICIEGKRLPF